MVNRDELEWWCAEYPDLDEEDILMVLEVFEEYYGEEDLNIEKTVEDVTLE